MIWVLRGSQFAAGAVVVVAAVLVLYAVRSVVGVVLLAVLLAEAIAPPVVWLRQRGAQRAQAVLLIYTAVGCAASALLWLLAGALAHELGDLAANLPQL